MSHSRRFVAVFSVLALLAVSVGAAKRSWVDSSGDFSIEAELIAVEGGKARLRKADGSEISVPVSRLSKKDQDYLKSQSTGVGLDAASSDDLKKITEQFYEDLRTTERNDAKGLLTKAAQKIAETAGSPLKQLPQPDDKSKAIRVGRVKLDGSVATVSVKVVADGKSHRTKLHLRTEDGAWRVFAISALIAGEEKTLDFESDKSGGKKENPVLKLVGKDLEVEGVMLNGRKLDWSQFKGKVVLIDFWATWCGPCMAEMPNIKENYKKFHDAGFEVVAISRDKDMKALKDYVAKENPPWTVLADHHPKNKKNMGAKVGIRSIPTFVLIGQDGKVAAVNCRGKRLGKELAKLLGDPSKRVAAASAKVDQR